MACQQFQTGGDIIGYQTCIRNNVAALNAGRLRPRQASSSSKNFESERRFWPVSGGRLATQSGHSAGRSG
jgi:hypothetical protein